MLHLAPHPDLKTIQEYVYELKKERGFFNNSLQQECLLLGEEVGELFKAVRKQQDMKLDTKSTVGSVDEELADILIYLCSIANHLEIDLEQALRSKEEANKQRTWTVGPQPTS